MQCADHLSHMLLTDCLCQNGFTSWGKGDNGIHHWKEHEWVLVSLHRDNNYVLLLLSQMLMRAWLFQYLIASYHCYPCHHSVALSLLVSNVIQSTFLTFSSLFTLCNSQTSFFQHSEEKRAINPNFSFWTSKIWEKTDCLNEFTPGYMLYCLWSVAVTLKTCLMDMRTGRFKTAQKLDKLGMRGSDTWIPLLIISWLSLLCTKVVLNGIS